jgi:hypothetical protein
MNAVCDCRERNPFFAKPQEDLTGTAALAKFLKHDVDGMLNPRVRVFLTAPIVAAHIPDWKRRVQLPALDHLLEGLVRPLTDEAHLKFAHRPFQA